MRHDIHPRYAKMAFLDTSTGTVFVTRSTRLPEETIEVNGEQLPVVRCDVTADSHPFWTGQRRAVDSEGRIERFRRRYQAAR